MKAKFYRRTQYCHHKISLRGFEVA